VGVIAAKAEGVKVVGRRLGVAAVVRSAVENAGARAAARRVSAWSQ
jgi:hypothetical protein